jgi:hypothetical protein
VWLQSIVSISNPDGNLVTGGGTPNINIPHSSLTNVEQADDTSSSTELGKHVTDAQVKVYGDHVRVIDGNPHGTDHTQLENIVGLGETHLNDNEYADVVAIPIIQQDSKDPTGWVDSSLISIEYNSASDTITLTGTLDYYWRGTKKSLVSPWTSTAHSATTGQSYFLSSTDGDTFTWSTIPWSFSDLMVAYVQHGATDLFGIRELHQLMDHEDHEEFHERIGTYLKSGGTIGTVVIGSTTPADRRPTVAETVIKDEDNPVTVPALIAGTYTTVSLTGASVSSFNVLATDIVPLSGNQPYYNSYSAPNWGQTLMSANTYMCIWLVAVPVTEDVVSQQYRFLWIQGQSAGSLATQQALTPNDLNLGSLTTMSPEYVFIGKVIIQYIGGNWKFTSTELLSGSKALYVASATGYLATVATDATLTGDGTLANPLSVVAGPGGGATQTFIVTFTSEDTTVVVNVVNVAISATSKIGVFIYGEEAAILEITGRLLLANTGSADIICHAPNGATGTYSGYISIS